MIAPEDYELHMANVGQAQANAELMRELVAANPGKEGRRLLIAGCGPGQFLECAPVDHLKPYSCVFTDLSPSFVEETRRRARDAGLAFEALVDDVEESRLEPGFAAIVLVLVLEHTDWNRVLDQMVRLQPERLVIVIQMNPTEMATMVTPNRELPGTLKACASGEKPHLIDREQLGAYLERLGFTERASQVRPVADGKSMVGLVFGPNCGENTR